MRGRQEYVTFVRTIGLFSAVQRPCNDSGKSCNMCRIVEDVLRLFLGVSIDKDGLAPSLFILGYFPPHFRKPFLVSW